MSAATADARPVLLLGGYGSLGGRIAHTLRALHPELPLAIAGRDASRAARLVSEIGVARATTVDLHRADLGVNGEFAAVVTALRDLSLNSLRFAQTRGIPYVALSDGVSELGPLVAQHLRHPAASPVLVLGHSMGGVPALAALHAAREFRTIDSVELGLLFDPDDPLGPASVVDMERIDRIAPAPLLMADGQWRWASDAKAERRFTGVGGDMHSGRAVALSDLLSLSVLDAKSIRVDAAVGVTASRRRGGPASLEVIIEIVGERRDGGVGRFRYTLVEPDGYATLSARGAAVAIERLLGLAGGPPPASGLHLPETIMEPAYLMGRLEMFGVRLVSAGVAMTRRASE